MAARPGQLAFARPGKLPPSLPPWQTQAPPSFPPPRPGRLTSSSNISSVLPSLPPACPGRLTCSSNLSSLPPSLPPAYPGRLTCSCIVSSSPPSLTGTVSRRTSRLGKEGPLPPK